MYSAKRGRLKSALLCSRRIDKSGDFADASCIELVPMVWICQSKPSNVNSYVVLFYKIRHFMGIALLELRRASWFGRRFFLSHETGQECFVQQHPPPVPVRCKRDKDLILSLAGRSKFAESRGPPRWQFADDPLRVFSRRACTPPTCLQVPERRLAATPSGER